MHAIYGLVDPRDRFVFYVGQTTDVYKRFLEHINCASNNFDRNVRILELRALNLMVIMEVFEFVEPQDEANRREAYWVNHFEQLQHPLTNIALMSSPKRSRRLQPKIATALARLADHEIIASGLQSMETQQGSRPAKALASASVAWQKEVSIDDAVATWNAGHNSIRKLSRALNIRFNHARGLIGTMQSKGLIDTRGEKQ